MKTFSINVQITGKVTVPDSLLRELRIAANEEPTDGGSRFLYDLNKATRGDDDEFLRRALSNSLRSLTRHGIIEDIGGLGVGCRCAPPLVQVSVPEHVVTKVKSREQVSVDRINVEAVAAPVPVTE